MLKLHLPRGDRTSIRIRGTHFGVTVDYASRTNDIDLATTFMERIAAQIERGESPRLHATPFVTLEKMPAPRTGALIRLSAVSYIYAIRSFDLIKVGLSKNVDARLTMMRLHNPHPMDVVIKQRCPRLLVGLLEKRIHANLAPYAVGREWFACSNEIVIEASKKAVADTGPDDDWKQEPFPTPPATGAIHD